MFLKLKIKLLTVFRVSKTIAREMTQILLASKLLCG